MEKVSEWLKAISTRETYQFHPRLRYDGPIVEIDSDARTYDPRFSKLLDDYTSAVERLSYCIEEFNDLIDPISDSFYRYIEAKKLGFWEETEEDKLRREAVLRI
jgi:hypothetical protein